MEESERNHFEQLYKENENTLAIIRQAATEKFGEQVSTDHLLKSIELIPDKVLKQIQQNEKPSVGLSFVYQHQPALVVENDSDTVAREIKWAVVLWNRDRPERMDPLPIPVKIFDWLKPHSSSGPQSLFRNSKVSSLVSKGDRLPGTASVNCPECIVGRTYILAIEFGNSGWFGEVTVQDGRLLIPKNFTRENREDYFDQLEALVAKVDRVQIQ